MNSADERILVRSVNQSVINANKFQKVIAILTLLVAIFASWVAYQQSIKDDARNVREELKDQNIKEVQRQINTLKLSLDSVRGQLKQKE